MQPLFDIGGCSRLAKLLVLIAYCHKETARVSFWTVSNRGLEDDPQSSPPERALAMPTHGLEVLGQLSAAARPRAKWK